MIDRKIEGKKMHSHLMYQIFVIALAAALFQSASAEPVAEFEAARGVADSG